MSAAPARTRCCKNAVASREGLIVGGSRIQAEQAVDEAHLGSPADRVDPRVALNIRMTSKPLIVT